MITLFCSKFKAESNSEITLKIGQHLSKFWPKSRITFYLLTVYIDLAIRAKICDSEKNFNIKRAQPYNNCQCSLVIHCSEQALEPEELMWQLYNKYKWDDKCK